MRVLVACEYSGRVRDAFRQAGHDAWSCDLLESDSDNKYHIVGDVRKEVNPGRWDLVIAHPPCTRLANSGVRWLAERNLWDDLKDAAEFYRFFQKLDCPTCIENPIIHKYARDLVNIGHRQVVQPWWFGEKTFKATGYELIGLPDLKPTDKLSPPEKGTEEHKKWSWVHRCPPGPNRWKIRSTTPLGIAKAMADQWGDL